MARRAARPRGTGPNYEEIFFTWSVPGMSLVLIGHMAEQHVFSHFGMALLSLGVYYYGKLKGLARLWQIGKQKLRVWPFPY